jgi:hypothetical protein
MQERPLRPRQCAQFCLLFRQTGSVRGSRIWGIDPSLSAMGNVEKFRAKIVELSDIKGRINGSQINRLLDLLLSSGHSIHFRQWMGGIQVCDGRCNISGHAVIPCDWQGIRARRWQIRVQHQDGIFPPHVCLFCSLMALNLECNRNQKLTNLSAGTLWGSSWSITSVMPYQ